MLKIGTLFSGIGAIEEALHKMNVETEIVFACDNGEREVDFDLNKVKIDTFNMTIKEKNQYIAQLYKNLSKQENYMQMQYEANFKVQDGHFYQDVRLLDGNVYKDKNLDLIVGGSPCQSFSILGKRGGLEDTRGTLFYEYARIVKEASPKAFIYENVLGMLNHDKGRTWETIYSVFESLGYNLKLLKLNSKNYGIPQDRKRIFLVGTKTENNLEIPKEINISNVMMDYLEEDVLPKYYLGKKGFEFVTNPKYLNRAKVNSEIMTCQKANQQFNWCGDFIFEKFDATKHDDKVLQKAFVGEYKGETGVCRQMTPRECLRLMGFSDDYKIVVNDKMAWRQSGNAIVVNVLESILKEMFEKGLL